MNKYFAMDQADKVGLGAAVGGHALLLALLLFGLLQATRPMGTDGRGSGDGIAVEIVSESSPAPAAPQAALDSAPVEPVQEIVEQPEVLPDAKVDPAPLPVPIPQPKIIPKPVQKSVSKPTPPVKRPTQTAATKPRPRPASSRPVAGTGSADFDRDMEKRLGGLGGGGTGPAKTKGPGEGATKGAATQTTAQIRSKASNTIAAEVRPLVQSCAPPTSDNSSLFVFVQLNIGPSANLIGANVYDVRGITPGNQAQVDAMKRCVLDSLRKASPYELQPDQYETWRNHKVQLKVNFK